jgi:hypothetical protein
MEDRDLAEVEEPKTRRRVALEGEDLKFMFFVFLFLFFNSFENPFNILRLFLLFSLIFFS